MLKKEAGLDNVPFCYFGCLSFTVLGMICFWLFQFLFIFTGGVVPRVEMLALLSNRTLRRQRWQLLPEGRQGTGSASGVAWRKHRGGGGGVDLVDVFVFGGEMKVREPLSSWLGWVWGFEPCLSN